MTPLTDIKAEIADLDREIERLKSIKALLEETLERAEAQQ